MAHGVSPGEWVIDAFQVRGGVDGGRIYLQASTASKAAMTSHTTTAIVMGLVNSRFTWPNILNRRTPLT
jgi:hypothetical protein